jgi:uncharacterized metal-binding protein YceD (DUF177 family)
MRNKETRTGQEIAVHRGGFSAQRKDDVMKIALGKPDQDLTLQVRGDEPWLERIYADFPTETGEHPRITGTLTVLREGEDGALVRGQLSYAPHVACSRCAEPVALPLSLKVEARFLPEGLNPDLADNWRRERNLSRSDLDAYYVAAGEVDLEEVLNDAIQAEIPSTYVPAADDGHDCLIAHEGGTGARVFGKEREDEDSSPFAALKKLKPKH